MILTLIKKIVATALGRWLLGGGVALLLSLGAWKFNAWKQDLIHKGQQVCVQEINKQTVTDLENALAAERVTSAALVVKAERIAVANAEAKVRQRNLESNVRTLQNAMNEQARTDNEYKEWNGTTLPAGVAKRMRNQATASDSSTVREDSN